MSRVSLALIIMVMSNTAMSSELFSKWSSHDKLMQSAFIGITCIDWVQTKDFRARGYPETNVVLGRYPSQSRVDNMIFLGMAAHTVMIWAIPREWRFVVQAFSIALETGSVLNNHNAGVNIIQISSQF